MKLIKYILGVLSLAMTLISIPDILRSIIPAINGWDNAIKHILFGIFLVTLFGYIGFKLIKSSQSENK